MSGEITQSALKKFLDDNRASIQQVAHKDFDVERGIKAALVTVSGNRDLMNADPISILRAVLESAYWGLEVSGAIGGADIIARWVKKEQKYIAHFQPNYYGYQKLVRRGNPNIVDIDVHEWYENDDVTIQYGTDPLIVHVPTIIGERGGWAGVYCVFFYRDGHKKFLHLTKEDVLYVRDTFSDGWKAFKAGKIFDSPWNKSEIEMAKKTVFLKLRKWVELSSGVVNLMVYDEQSEAGEDVQPPEAVADRLKVIVPQGSEGKTTAEKVAEVARQQAAMIEAPKERMPMPDLPLAKGSVIEHPAPAGRIDDTGAVEYGPVEMSITSQDINLDIPLPEVAEDGAWQEGNFHAARSVMYTCNNCTLQFGRGGVEAQEDGTYLCHECMNRDDVNQAKTVPPPELPAKVEPPTFFCTDCRKAYPISKLVAIGRAKLCPDCANKRITAKAVKKDTAVCVACKGTGMATNGRTCVPCNGAGTKLPDPKPPAPVQGPVVPAAAIVPAPTEKEKLVAAMLAVGYTREELDALILSRRRAKLEDLTESQLKSDLVYVRARYKQQRQNVKG